MMTSKFVSLTRKVGMGKSLQYMLYTTVCIVSFIIALIIIWWFLEKPYTKEDFIVPAPYMVMVGLSYSSNAPGDDGSVYYADIDVPMNPKWIISGLNGIGDIAGSYGKLYTVGNGLQKDKVLGHGGYDSATRVGGGDTASLRYISVDDDGTVVGVNEAGSNNAVYARTVKDSYKSAGATVASAAISGGKMFSIGADRNLYYHSKIPINGARVNVAGVGDSGWKHVTFDGGVVCALTEQGGNLWCADSNIEYANANWKQQGTKQFTSISLKGGRLVGIATDDKIYYSNSYTSPVWTEVSMKQYDSTGAVSGPGVPRLKKVILMYPSLDARRKRFLGSAAQCNHDEQRIGNLCYAPCASGRAGTGTKCPYRRKQTPAIALCASGDYINGSCYQPCTNPNSTASGDKCLGMSKVKDLKTRKRIEPAYYSCPKDGAVAARYVRIRPTTLIENNKLCISKVVVKTADGAILSLPSGMPNLKSTIGSMSGTGISNNKASIPIQAMKVVNTPEGGSLTAPLNIYVAEEGGVTKMISSDTVGTAKYYAGALASWTDDYWISGTANGVRADKKYMLTLNTAPVKVFATDGTCVDAPIGGGSCAGSFNTYLSSSKYDTELNGGMTIRANKTYWEVDLGASLNIKTIEFTGCNYITAGATPNRGPVDAGATSQPSADQIKGMRIELSDNNGFINRPIASRTMGSEVNQVFTFTYLSREEGVETICYDDCPKINGVQSLYSLDGTCVAASGGVTSRSVTSPLPLREPVCGLPKNADGSDFSIVAKKKDGTPWNIGNWKINPSDPAQLLSCDVLPGSTLLPLRASYGIPRNSHTIPEAITYTLQDNDNNEYTADPKVTGGYKCVKLEQSMCDYYNVGGKQYKLTGNLCMRTDVSPGFEMNRQWLWSPEDQGRWSDCPHGYRTDPVTCYKWECDTDAARTAIAFTLGAWLIGRGCVLDRHKIYDSNSEKLWGGLMWPRCPAGYSRHYLAGVEGARAPTGWCVQDKKNPTWGDLYIGPNYDVGDGAAHTELNRYALKGPNTIYKSDNLRNLNGDSKPLVSNPPDSSRTSEDNFKIPLIRRSSSIIADPHTFPSQCRCLNGDGTVNKEAYLYNNKCVKCASSNQFFYTKGAISDSFKWGPELKNKFLSMYDDAVTRPIDQKPFTNLIDAKRMCETDPFCKGITRSYDRNGTPYYYMRAGTVPTGLAPPSSGSSGSIHSSALTTSTAQLYTWDSSWKKNEPDASTMDLPIGKRANTPYSTDNIPTAFADDYISPHTKGSSPMFRAPTTTASSLIASMTNDVLEAAGAWTSWLTAVQNPNTYYTLVGVERKLSVTNKPPDNGICVAPCDIQHSEYDPIRMIYDRVNNEYILYGTTCHDATQVVINKPSIPAIYNPQKGEDCENGFDLNTAGSCAEECEPSALDDGVKCSEVSTKRPSIEPILSCASNLKLIGGVCVHECEPGFIENGDYCEPLTSTLDIPSTIKCTKAPYKYSSKYQGSSPSSSLVVNKWLCDSPEDQYALVQGPSDKSVASSYVNPNDIICYADDSSTGMYYCQSVYDAINQTEDSQRTSFSTTCDTLTKSYFDLSNNLTILMSANNSAQKSAMQTAGIEMTLRSVIEKMCGSASGSGSGSGSRSTPYGSPATCNALRTQLSALHSNINSGSGTTSGILTPIAIARSSRDKLISLLRDIKCCPPDETSYPWCD